MVSKLRWLGTDSLGSTLRYRLRPLRMEQEFAFHVRPRRPGYRYICAATPQRTPCGPSGLPTSAPLPGTPFTANVTSTEPSGSPPHLAVYGLQCCLSHLAPNHKPPGIWGHLLMLALPSRPADRCLENRGQLLCFFGSSGRPSIVT